MESILLVAILVDPRFRIFITLIDSATISGFISSSTCALNQENFSKKSRYSSSSKNTKSKFKPIAATVSGCLEEIQNG